MALVKAIEVPWCVVWNGIVVAINVNAAPWREMESVVRNVIGVNRRHVVERMSAIVVSVSRV